MHRVILRVGVLATLVALSGCSDSSAPTTAPTEDTYLFSNMALYGVWMGTTKQDSPIAMDPDTIMAVFRLDEMEFYTKRDTTWTRDMVEAYGPADPDVGFRMLRREPIVNRLYYGTRSVARVPADPDTIAGKWYGFGTGTLGQWKVWYVGSPD